MDEKITTRDKILDAALTLFSEKGFDGVGVDELAELAGVKGPAIYYYFKGKDAVFDGVVGMLEEYYATNFGSAQNIRRFPESTEELITMSLARINYTMHDPQIKKIRRLIVSEQFRDERMCMLATKHFLTGLEDLYTAIFVHMMQDKLLRQDDAGILAMEFTAPITQLIHLVDRHPDREAEAIERMTNYMEHFVKIYEYSEH